jgi:hypothetical protein
MVTIMGLRLLGVGIFGHQNIYRALEKIESEINFEYLASIEAHSAESSLRQDEILSYFDFLNLNFSTDHCRPIDSELLRKMSVAENIYLKMLDRLDPNEEMTYEKRKHHYLKQVIYWNDYLEDREINHVLFFNFPHEMHDYVIYELCKLKGISKTILDDINFLPDTLFIVRDIEKSCEQIPLYLEKIKKSNSISSLGKTKDYIESFWGKEKNETPKLIKELIEEKNKKESRYFNFINFLHKIVNLIKMPEKLFNIDLWYRRKHSMEKKEDDLFQYYDQHCEKTPDLKKKYIYLALHYQPECSSSPMGGAWVEQELIADIISKSMPEDYYLYIKEHPLQKKYGRSRILYESVVKLPRTHLIDRNYSSFELLQSSVAVATITGTAGWEGFLNSKPVLKFGSSFYQYAPGVFKINSVEDIISAFEKITTGVLITKDIIIQYLAALEMASVSSWTLDFLKQPMTQIGREKAIINLSNALRQELISFK